MPEEVSSCDCIADIGYFDGRQSSKMSLVSDRDVLSMYQKAKKDDMFLWVEVSACDSDDDHAPGRKKRRKEKEDEVEDIFDELKKHA